MSGGQPFTFNAAAAKRAASKQCAVRSRITRRGDRQVSPSGSVLYGIEFRKSWIFHGLESDFSRRVSWGVRSFISWSAYLPELREFQRASRSARNVSDRRRPQ